MLLAAVAAALVWFFGGDTHALIPLYSVGVFVCFTLSPDRDGPPLAPAREPRLVAGGRRSTAIGAVLTPSSLVVVTSVKFTDGAYLVVILIPLLVAMMLFIHRQYDASRRELRVRPRPRVRVAAARGTGGRPDPRHQPGGRPGRQRRPLDRRRRPGRVHHRRCPRTASSSARALGAPAPGRSARGRRVAVPRADRAAAGLSRRARPAWPPDKAAPITFVVLPEYVARSWWERILYNQSAKRLRSALLGRPHTVVVNVPYRREDPTLFEKALGEAVGPELGRRYAVLRDGAPSHAGTGGGMVAAVPTSPPRSRSSAAPSWPRRTARATPDPARRRGGEGPTRRSSSGSTSSRSTGRCRSTWTSPAARRRSSRSSTSPKAQPRASASSSKPVLLQARDVGAALVDEAIERDADLLVVGLPYRTKFGGDFAMGRTIPYVLKNAPCAVWVVREPIPEETL